MLRFNDIQEGDTLRFTKSNETSSGFHGVVFTVLKKYMRKYTGGVIRPCIDMELVTPSRFSTNEAGTQLIGVTFSEARFEHTTVNPAYLLFS
jgi:hypothetical protein